MPFLIDVAVYALTIVWAGSTLGPPHAGSTAFGLAGTAPALPLLRHWHPLLEVFATFINSLALYSPWAMPWLVAGLALFSLDVNFVVSIVDGLPLLHVLVALDGVGVAIELGVMVAYIGCGLLWAMSLHLVWVGASSVSAQVEVAQVLRAVLAGRGHPVLLREFGVAFAGAIQIAIILFLIRIAFHALLA